MEGNPFFLLCIVGPLLLGSFVFALTCPARHKRNAWSAFAGVLVIALALGAFLGSIARDEALFQAVQDKDVARVRQLLRLGANPDYDFEGKTARQEAWNEDSPPIRALIPKR